MRIAVLADATMPTPTAGTHGLGRVTSTVAEGLLARGHDVVLFARSGSAFRGALVMPGDANGYIGERAIAREALKLHREWPFDCFLDHGHLHYLSHMLPDLPVVNVYHDNYQPYARCPVLLSEGQRALMPPAFETARIIPNTLNAADYEPCYAYSAPDYALFVGAWGEIKQPLLAIEACARLGIKLVMAGQPVNGKLPIAGHENVEYVGMIDGTYKAELFQHARIFLQLGIGESFGLTTLEAGLYGTPVVGWPAGGTLDLIRYGLSGTFVCMSGEDKVQNVCDAIERAWFIRRDGCRAWAESLCDPERQIDQYEDALADVARGVRW
jgi:glycosyltransferase involved in cell wall biosynthesis